MNHAYCITFSPLICIMFYDRHHIMAMKRRNTQLICIHCGHKQDLGNFCGKCGAARSQNIDETKEPPFPSRHVHKPNPTIQSIKDQAKKYWQYFKVHLKAPMQLYEKYEQEFVNGVMSIILFSILIALSFFSLIRNALSTTGSESFYSTFGGIFIFSCLSVGLVLVTLTLINHFFGPQYAFKSIVSLFGGHLPITILLLLLSVVLTLLKSFVIGFILLFIAFSYTIFLLPLYLISALLTKKSSGSDPFFGFIIYVVTFSILFTLFMTLLADTRIGLLLNHLGSWL